MEVQNYMLAVLHRDRIQNSKDGQTIPWTEYIAQLTERLDSFDMPDDPIDDLKDWVSVLSEVLRRKPGRDDWRHGHMVAQRDDLVRVLSWLPTLREVHGRDAFTLSPNLFFPLVGWKCQNAWAPSPPPPFTVKLNEDETTLVIEALFLFTGDDVGDPTGEDIDEATTLIKRLDSALDAHVRASLPSQTWRNTYGETHEEEE